MHTLGHNFGRRRILRVACGITARRTLLQQLVTRAWSRPPPNAQNGVFEAAIQFARDRGHRPGAESASRDWATIDEALRGA